MDPHLGDSPPRRAAIGATAEPSFNDFAAERKRAAARIAAF
jgi:hypothetical protein